MSSESTAQQIISIFDMRDDHPISFAFFGILTTDRCFELILMMTILLRTKEYCYTITYKTQNNTKDKFKFILDPI